MQGHCRQTRGPQAGRRQDAGNLRACTDRTRNASNFLYGPDKKIALVMGVRAVGAQVVSQVEAKEWSVPSRPRESQAVYGKAKVKWEL